MKKIGIATCGDGDMLVIKKAVDVLKPFDVPFEVHIYSTHRTPDSACDFALNARKNGFGAA